MYVGVINRRLVCSAHPFIVVCHGGVAAGFATLEAARKFLAPRGFRAGLIYGHTGRDWDMVESDPLAMIIPEPEPEPEASTME